VALDRSFIEKRDFPTGRRGYDTAAVDEHLRAVADEVQALRARADAAPPTTSAAASERVGAIIAAAEATAADIERSARDEAARIRAEAASGTSAEVEAVRAVATRLRERAEELERELSVLVASVGELAPQAPVAPRVPEPEPSPAIAAAAAPDPIPIAPPVAPEPAAALAATRHAADAENARVVALSMALGGTPRAETDRYLAANYGGLPDREGLLDEVYASVGR
jgi:DivIVA domain-containing protein